MMPALLGRPCTFAAAIASLVLIAGCAAPGLTTERASQKKPGSPSQRIENELTLWRVADLARAEQIAILLRSPQGIHGSMDTATAKRILGVADRLIATVADGPKPELAIVASATVNAFAFFNGIEPTIAISQGMVRLLGEDDAAWAALIGHELAHLRLEHIKRQIDRRQRTDTASSLAGAVLSAIGLPFASLATDATAVLANRAFSRDDEREADRVGLEYMRNAGYRADGALRLQQLLFAAGGSAGLPFLSTHPGGEERIENMKQLMQSGN